MFWQPFTLLGFTLLLLSICLLYYIGFPLSDLTVRIVGLCFCLLVVISALLVGLGRIFLRKIAIDIPPIGCDYVSGEPVRLFMSITNCVLLPLLTLEIYPIFRQKGQNHKPRCSGLIVVSNCSPSQSLQTYIDISFPHRGVWEISSFQLRLCDKFELIAIVWSFSKNISIEISAPVIHINPLPVFTSSSRDGELLGKLPNDKGELFNLKPYDVSYGTARILWKIFARTGELVVRAPEPASFPEGRVAIYLIAERDQDYVVACFQDYLRVILEKETSIVFGTDGLISGISDGIAKQQIVNSGSVILAADETEIMSSINEVVWHKSVGTGENFVDFCNAIAARGDLFDAIAVFAPESSTSEWWRNVLHVTSNEKLVFFLVPEFSNVSYVMQSNTSLYRSYMSDFLSFLGYRNKYIQRLEKRKVELNQAICATNASIYKCELIKSA